MVTEKSLRNLISHLYSQGITLRYNVETRQIIYKSRGTRKLQKRIIDFLHANRVLMIGVLCDNGHIQLPKLKRVEVYPHVPDYYPELPK